jgi:uncharacterized protein (UPF0261 family)
MEKSKKTIVLVGRIDSKGNEYAFIRDRILAGGFKVIVVDSGSRGTPLFEADIPRTEVARAAGAAMDKVVDRSDENVEIQVMMKGAAEVVRGLYDSGRLDGIVCLGGSRGTAIGTAAMRALPFGIPKVMVSTIASGDMRPYVGTRDITVIHAVMDIFGLNRMTKRLLAYAAGAVMGAVASDREPEIADNPLVAMSSMGGLNRAAFAAYTLLEESGFEVVAFHTVGTGGQAMEETIEQGLVAGVFDLVTHELTDHLFGGIFDSGPLRLESAGSKGIPQVIAPGCLDFVTFSPPDKIPAGMEERKVFRHTPEVGLIRMNKDEMERIAGEIAGKLNRATGPTAIIIPTGGFSPGNREGRALYDPNADAAFVEVLKQDLNPSVRLVEVDAHINDAAFAERAVELFKDLMRSEAKAYSKTPSSR